jgi:osmotically-inducible protein OsmY
MDKYQRKGDRSLGESQASEQGPFFQRRQQNNYGRNFGEGARPYGEDYGEDPEDFSQNKYARERSYNQRDTTDGERKNTSYTNRRESGYSDEDYPYYRERIKSSNYPDTYRSAQGGYMSEYVGDDLGNREYQNYIPRTYKWSNRGKGPRNYKRSDERISDDIHDWLTDDHYVDASDIHIEVREGEVVLSGTVKDRWEKRRAENIAELVSGVKQVENRIKVTADKEREIQ